jgi:hypothetical protein
MKDKFGNIAKTGPAASHHMGKILPTHNIFKPGAHPSKKKDEKKDNHHDQKDKHENKADELKNRLKPIRIE